jgi:hypothetical protein
MFGDRGRRGLKPGAEYGLACLQSRSLTRLTEPLRVDYPRRVRRGFLNVRICERALNERSGRHSVDPLRHGVAGSGAATGLISRCVLGAVLIVRVLTTTARAEQPPYRAP